MAGLSSVYQLDGDDGHYVTKNYGVMAENTSPSTPLSSPSEKKAPLGMTLYGTIEWDAENLMQPSVDLAFGFAVELLT